MKPKTPRPKLKARRMWANYYNADEAAYFHPTQGEARRMSSGAARHEAVPVAVIPLDDVPALIRIAGDAFHDSYDGHICQADIVAMLAAIGVLPKQRKGRK